MNAWALMLVSMACLTGCINEPRARWYPVAVEEHITLESSEEVLGCYRSGDAFHSVSYTFYKDGTLRRQFIPDDLGQIRDPEQGRWRRVGELDLEIEWKEHNGTQHRESLRFLAAGGRLAFVEKSFRRRLEAEGAQWRDRAYIFIKYEEPNKAPEPTRTAVTPRAEGK